MVSGARRADIGREAALAIDEDRPIRVVVKDAAGDPVTMTGWTLEWGVVDNSDDTVLLTKTTGAGEITLATTDGTDDTAVITVDDPTFASIMRSASAGTYRHYLKRTTDTFEAFIVYGSIFIMRIK